MAKFPHVKQRDQMDCGPTCLKMITKHYGKNFSLPFLRENAYIGKQGVSLLGIATAAEKIGLRTLSVQIDIQTLIEEKPVPFIAHWNQNHFVVVYKITNKKVFVADPASQLLEYSHEEFKKAWIQGQATEGEDGEERGIALLLETSPDFYAQEDVKESKATFGYLLKYLKPYKAIIFQLFLGLLGATLLSLFLPLLTQALVDTGIQQKNLSFVYVVLAAQLVFFVSKNLINLIRSWILLQVSVRLNIQIVSDFLAKLIRLPLPFFESKNLGDILQRMQDNQRIEQFLSGTLLDFIFSLASLFSVGILVIFYSPIIFLLFLIGSSLYVTWILLFLKKRRLLDDKRFALSSSTQSNEVELVQGMAEIKFNNFEKEKRWEWERLQVKRAKLAMQSLRLSQLQQYGGGFINELKNIIITFWAAYEVIQGSMTLGMMMAVQQVLGQMEVPLIQSVSFIQQGQDAKLSLERLGEIHDQKDEDEESENSLIKELPVGEFSKDIYLKNVTFRYGTPHSQPAIDDLTLHIPAGKTTAIVGESGSGKTTLLKLLLKYYIPQSGQITVGSLPLPVLSSSIWRATIGSVMQEGFIFSESIAKNIALGDDNPTQRRLIEATQTANIFEHIQSLPLGFHTKVGQSGEGLSQGQKQRLLIARAVYKNPEYLFFDEATSALDAKNEKIISKNLQNFGQSKTQIIIAHRLSTVKNADQIVFLEKGKIKELGTHEELVKKRGMYYNLVKNQLELAG
ncbi:peptidase domain-containing ABC transporter [Bernardetia sp.]|uniref:peptidase domain-containing ABC transporter n=1 Tax=Bernardetia sp. TaxID=1937974 RepID=UPI0025C1F305|nr:peptidase domain-containing ABC transporter [Bernardetia sp.]